MEDVSVSVVSCMDSSLQEMNISGKEFSSTVSLSQRAGNNKLLSFDGDRLYSFVSWDEGEVDFCSVPSEEKVELGK